MLMSEEIQFGVLLQGRDESPIYFDTIKKKYNKGTLNLYVGRKCELSKLLTTYVKEDEYHRNNIDNENIIIVFSCYKGFIKVNKTEKGQYEIILQIDSSRFIPRHSITQFGYLRPVDFYKKVAEVFIDIVNDKSFVGNRLFTEESSNHLIECN